MEIKDILLTLCGVIIAVTLIAWLIWSIVVNIKINRRAKVTAKERAINRRTAHEAQLHAIIKHQQTEIRVIRQSRAEELKEAEDRGYARAVAKYEQAIREAAKADLDHRIAEAWESRKVPEEAAV